MAVVLALSGTVGGLVEVGLEQAALLQGRSTVGASGAILGLLGALLAFFVRGTLRERAPLARQRLGALVAVVALQVGVDLLTPEVSLLGHAVGIGTGLLVGLGLTLPGARKAPTAAGAPVEPRG
jgi:membrane associated rhomboid family serine protease